MVRDGEGFSPAKVQNCQDDENRKRRYLKLLVSAKKAAFQATTSTSHFCIFEMPK